MTSFFGWICTFILFWGIAAVVTVLAALSKSDTGEKIAIWLFAVPVILFLFDDAREFWHKHKHNTAIEEVKLLCAKDGGDKIYKTADNVQGVLQIRARKSESYRRPDGSFYYAMNDQYGMEDPYGKIQGDTEDGLNGYVGDSSIFPEAPPMGKQGYWFAEQRSTDGQSYRRSYLSPIVNKYNERQELSYSGDLLFEVKEIYRSKPKSQYGYLTEDLTTKEMRNQWIGAGRIKIIDLNTNEVLAERKGYFSADGDYLPTSLGKWTTTGNDRKTGMCPSGRGLLEFLHSVLTPVEGYPTNEQLESIAKD